MVVRAQSDISTLKDQRHHCCICNCLLYINTDDTMAKKCKVMDKIINLRSVDASGSN